MILASYQKRQVCLFYGGFRRTERTNSTMSGTCTILPCLSRNRSKSVRELVVVHTHRCTYLGMRSVLAVFA